MHPFFKQIADYGIPTDSIGSVVVYLNGRDDLSRAEYERRIIELSGVQKEYIDDRDAKYCFLYLVQETFRKLDSTDILDMAERLDYAIVKARTYIENNQWVWAVADDDDERVDSDGKPKRKKGAKQVEALRIYKENVDCGKPVIIERFMNELDMSKSGATTYFYNMKKKVENEQ